MAKKHVVRAYPAPADAKNNGEAVAVAPAAAARVKPAKTTKPAAPKKAAKPAKPPTPAKAPKASKPAKQPKPKRLSALDAAAKVIAGASKPMRAVDLVAEMEKRGLWKSPAGKTPEASVYAAILREIQARKGEARFKKVDRGLFLAGKGA